jgi:hypothetical protein
LKLRNSLSIASQVSRVKSESDETKQKQNERRRRSMMRDEAGGAE